MKRALLVVLLSGALVACNQTPQERDGETIYNQSCFSCHERGHGGAPVRGDLEEWQPRLAKGKDVLLKNLKEGYNGMPPKGACFDCNDQELQKVLAFILDPNNQ